MGKHEEELRKLISAKFWKRLAFLDPLLEWGDPQQEHFDEFFKISFDEFVEPVLSLITEEAMDRYLARVPVSTWKNNPEMPNWVEEGILDSRNDIYWGNCIPDDLECIATFIIPTDLFKEPYGERQAKAMLRYDSKEVPVHCPVKREGWVSDMEYITEYLLPEHYPDVKDTDFMALKGNFPGMLMIGVYREKEEK